MWKELVPLEAPLLAAIPQPQIFINGCFFFVLNSRGYATFSK